jgi:hypothetical protein
MTGAAYFVIVGQKALRAVLVPNDPAIHAAPASDRGPPGQARW